MSCAGGGNASISQGTLEIIQGDDYAQDVLIRTNEGHKVDLTGWSAFAQVRRGPADDYPNEVICNILTTVFELESRVGLNIPRSITRTLTGGPYVWDMELLSPDDVNATVIGGDVTIMLEVTRV